jgi:hypothetical protein
MISTSPRRSLNVVVAGGLLTAVFAGIAGSSISSVTPQSFLYAVSSLGWVAATAVLARLHGTLGEPLVAAGFLVLTIAECLLWVNGRPGDPYYELGFAGGTMFYVPGLLMVAASPVYHRAIRLSMLLAAGVWGVAAIRFLAGSAIESGDALAVAGYVLVSLGFGGVAVSVQRGSLEPAGGSQRERLLAEDR